jgi:catechol 2,3-dioxygenase-like lactoylglutathione lyase family enzyme
MSGQASKLSWGHININVADLNCSIEFYERLGFEMFIPSIPYLGLTAEPGSTTMSAPAAHALGLEAETTGRACIMQLDDGFPKIDLIEITNQEGKSPLTNADLGLVRICLLSENLEEDYALLSAQGVKFITGPQPGKDGLADVAICIDPDGTLIELLQPYLDKWAAFL